MLILYFIQISPSYFAWLVYLLFVSLCFSPVARVGSSELSSLAILSLSWVICFLSFCHTFFSLFVFLRTLFQNISFFFVSLPPMLMHINIGLQVIVLHGILHLLIRSYLLRAKSATNLWLIMGDYRKASSFTLFFVSFRSQKTQWG